MILVKFNCKLIHLLSYQTIQILLQNALQNLRRVEDVHKLSNT